jgi:hypothetical protein
MARWAGMVPACGACELGRARRHLERAVAELEEARLAWGVWADDIRWMTEQRLGVADFVDHRVMDDPGYGRALDMGTPFNEAVSAARTALKAAGGGEDPGAGGVADCPCVEVKAQIGSPHP